jgi:hypothetical protein
MKISPNLPLYKHDYNMMDKNQFVLVSLSNKLKAPFLTKLHILSL